jgi:hypothetical protein
MLEAVLPLIPFDSYITVTAAGEKRPKIYLVRSPACPKKLPESGETIRYRSIIQSAPGRTRTCDRQLRRLPLCPLSYGGVGRILANYA